MLELDNDYLIGVVMSQILPEFYGKFLEASPNFLPVCLSKASAKFVGSSWDELPNFCKDLLGWTDQILWQSCDGRPQFLGEIAYGPCPNFCTDVCEDRQNFCDDPAEIVVRMVWMDYPNFVGTLMGPSVVDHFILREHRFACLAVGNWWVLLRMYARPL